MKNQTINNHFSSAQAMIRNAQQHPGVQQKLTEWGFGNQLITRGEAILSNAQLVQQTKKECYSAKQDTARAWKTTWTGFRQQYAEHRTVAKTIFRQEPNTLERLRLDRGIPARISDILDQAADFYQVIVSKGKDMQKLGVKTEELTQAQMKVVALSELRAQRLQRKGEAESATQKRQEALAELRTWQREFIRVAKMALKDDPQLLEVLGIVVPA